MAALVVLVSICEAFVTWRAAVTSNRASDLDQQAMQQLLLRQREESSIQGSVASDFHVFERFQQHAMLWTLLGQQADKAGRRGLTELASDLRIEAATELGQAKRLQRLFVVQFPNLPDNETGRAPFSPRGLIAGTIRVDSQIQGIHPDVAFGAARDEHDRAVRLVGIAALLAAALVLLTLAQLSRRATRHVYGFAGVAVWIAAMTLFALSQAVGG
jgi:hypothetical protein